MNNFSKQLTQQEVDYIYSKLQNHQVENKSDYLLYSFKYNNLNILIYKSLKIVIQGNNIELFLNEFGLNNSYKLSVNTKYEIGSDETGVGDLIGGLVVCCTKIDNELVSKLNEYEINDSKKLTDKYILSIYDELIKIVPHKIVAISAKKYNELNNTFKNSHVLKAILHNEAHAFFDSENSTRIIDQFSTTDKKYYEYVNASGLEPIKIDIFEPKAESKYPSVALASIIARGWFLKQIEKLSKKINMAIPLGAWNTKIKDFCHEFVKKYSKDALLEIIKHDFKVELPE